ncbi:hypothetical protein MASR1M59_15280 [Melaminivora sp.]
MLVSKIIALTVLVSWLTSSGSRLYDYLASSAPEATASAPATHPANHWNIHQLRW